MDTGRRLFLSGVAAVVAGTHALVIAAAQSQHDPRPPITQLPDASNSTGVETSPRTARAQQKALLKEQQKELRRDIDRMVQMVTDLKDESDKTPETEVLSMSLVKKTEDIEKLARTIRDRIRAS
jgi:hypothetical protein